MEVQEKEIWRIHWEQEEGWDNKTSRQLQIENILQAKLLQ